MKTLAKELDVHTDHAMKRFSSDEITKMHNVLCTATIITTNAVLAFHDRHDEQFPNRPYLHLMGYCCGIKGELPYNINEVSLPQDKGMSVDVFYEFTDDDLAELVRKGLYHKGFKCPEMLFNAEIEMPAYCDFTIINPVKEGDFPIVFSQIVDAHNIAVETDTCGYNFAEYFEQLQLDELDNEWLPAEEMEIEEESVINTAEPANEEEFVSDDMQPVEDENGFLVERYADISKRIEQKLGSEKAKVVEDVVRKAETVSDGKSVDDITDMFADEPDDVNTEGVGRPKHLPAEFEDIAQADAQTDGAEFDTIEGNTL